MSDVQQVTDPNLNLLEGLTIPTVSLNHYNELITLIDRDRRIRTTQLFEDGVYKLVTMIDETKSS